jgi:acetolactate synthase-1/2/3 large subunit
MDSIATNPGAGQPAEDMTAAQAVVKTLVANGLRTLFALPGVQNDHLFDALHDAQDQIRIIHPRHEQGAAYMAMGAAMATGAPSGCCVVPGPGVLNASAALCTAYAVGAPVLCLTGQIPSAAIGRGFGLLHELPDQLGVLRTLTKWAERISCASDAAPLTTEAFRQLRSGRPRPVALECPLDIWPQHAPASPALAEAVAPPEIDQDAVNAAARLLGAARSPVILVGGGAFGAMPEIRALAEMLQAPVISHRMGRGVLDSRHPLSLHAETGHALWPEVDVALAIGTRLQTPLMLWGRDDALKLIHVEIDPDELGRFGAADVPIPGDAAAVARALLDAIGAHNRKRPSRGEEMAGRKATSAARLARLVPQQELLAAIRDELPEDGIFVDEVTQLGHAARVMFPIYRPRSFLTPGYQGTLGWGVATAIGAQVARPDVPVVAISGDGGFMFTMPELATAAQHRVPLVVVLVNDGAYGNVRRTQIEEFGNRTLCTDLVNPDFLKLAEAFGIAGYRARGADELRVALRRAFARRETALIEVPVGAMPSPWPILRFKKVRGA